MTATVASCLADGCPNPGAGKNGYCPQHRCYAANERWDATLNASDRHWLTKKEAMERSKACRRTVERAIEMGALPGTRVGRSYRIAPDAFHDWVKTLPASRARQGRHVEPAATLQRRTTVKALYPAAVGELAKATGVSKPTIYKDLDKLGLAREGKGRRVRKLLPKQRAERKRQAAERYQAGDTLKQIAKALDSSITQIASDLEEMGVARRPSASVKGSPPAEHKCEYCGDPFTPDRRSHDRRFCRREHWRLWKKKAASGTLKERGLLRVDQVAEQIPGMGKRQVIWHIRKKHLKTERVTIVGVPKPAYGVRPEEAKRFIRWLATTGDRRRRRFEDPKHAVALAEGNGTIKRLIAQGHTVEQAHDVVLAAAARRHDLLAPHRKGRKRARGPSEDHQRWWERFQELVEDRDYCTERIELKLVSKLDKDVYEEATERAKASDYGLARIIAQEDWREHPDKWDREKYRPAPGDPETLHPKDVRPAAEKILAAIKSLQNALRKISSP